MYIARNEEMPPGAPMRDVTIKGTDQQRRTAEQMIEDLLATKEREGPPPGLFFCLIQQTDFSMLRQIREEDLVPVVLETR